MKKFRILAACLVCFFTLVGCSSRSAYIMNVNQPIAAHYSIEQVKTAIIQAGQQREWVMTPVAPGVINGHINQRGHIADIRINYSTSSYSINYVSSQNLRAANGKIHRNYNRWINNLDREIQLRLSAQLIK
ncbi:hypothetical protein ACLEEB_11425 [Lonsdalea quercina]|uniref:Lipoprotein n=1 Tax=Lonsdalea quercina TaxID=71657 RepID=A0A1H4CD48_9GAMM|nr:hypothetical protein [Lonsdalea quercina]SEA58327.1 hypothetical protein SAMN02982996_01940 [Lonsdalea quercina]